MSGGAKAVNLTGNQARAFDAPSRTAIDCHEYGCSRRSKATTTWAVAFRGLSIHTIASTSISDRSGGSRARSGV